MTDDLAAFRSEARAVLRCRLQLSVGSGRARGMGAGDGDDALDDGRSYLSAMSDGGWSVPTWSKRFGGAGLSRPQLAILTEELAAYEVPDLYPFLVGIGMAGPSIMSFGDERQQRRWLPRIRDGSEIWCQLFSEPDAGSDLASLDCRAEADGDFWQVTGQKVWASRAHYSDWGFLLARTDRSVPKHKGLTAFAVDMSAPGLEIRPIRQINGDHHFNEVFFDNVHIKDEFRIGERGEGWRVAVVTLSHERGLSETSAGGFDPEDVVRLAHRFPHADPTMRDRLARAWCNLKVAQLTAARARARHAIENDVGPEASGAKLRHAGAFKELSSIAMDLLGMTAISGEDPWITLFLTAPSMSIRGGTDEIQKNIIGERVLGLPPEPSLDKDVPFNERLRTR